MNGQALPLSTGLDVVLERCPCQFHKPLVIAEKVLTITVHFVWAWGAKIMDVPRHCGCVLHLHALVQKRDHFMPLGLPDEHKVGGTWVLTEQGSGLLQGGGGRSIVNDFYNSTLCAGLRNMCNRNQVSPYLACVSATGVHCAMGKWLVQHKL